MTSPAGSTDPAEALTELRAGRPWAQIAAELGVTRAQLGAILANAASYGGHLVTAAEVAEHYGITEPSARRLMADNGITRVQGYPAELALRVPRPGRGARTDLTADLTAERQTP